MSIYCIYVEKKAPFAVEARTVLDELQIRAQSSLPEGLRIINRYMVENISQQDFNAARDIVFSSPQVDDTYDALPDFGGARILAVESLPGQYDQRADVCSQCLAAVAQSERPLVRTARIYVLDGSIDDATFDIIKKALINPVESREASLELPETLAVEYPIPDTVETVDGFISLDEKALAQLLESMGLAMDIDDLKFCQSYFKDSEKRDPTITEIRMIDTYWSDHCRHTTFLTHLDNINIEPKYVKVAWELYNQLRKRVHGGDDRPVTLMDMATIGAKALHMQGSVPELDISEEINACSVKITVDVNGSPEDWLLMFKNETHNHPTEIEPFGGAATCLGGAIRDPLSGRAYVYQAMRITGAANPLTPVSDTLDGKLPQRHLCTTAAQGYSSYGNQIGLSSGHIHEIYHDGYAAKRMELGAVIAAAPVENVVRKSPQPGDVVIMLGGPTGRDGCGGATGSSKSHTTLSLEQCSSEVQKGDPLEERKIQRLFRNPDATKLILRCNDFGAGGVSVSIGELADGLHINLDAVPTKYDGLDGTELAISESQERMSVVVHAADAEKFIALAEEQNLEAVVVAEVTHAPRLVMNWKKNVIVNISREFLNSNGAPKKASALIPEIELPSLQYPNMDGIAIKEQMASLEQCSRKGLSQLFDSTAGGGTVIMPYGGKNQLTPAQAMVAKIPVPYGETKTCSLMAWGYNPEIAEISPFHGGQAAVIESISKIIASGGCLSKCWLTFQEYFERLGSDPQRWGKPVAAMLGALEAQMELGCASIGGKDSMSGSFEDIDVPPTLVSFAVSVATTDNIISPEFMQADSFVYLLKPTLREDGLPKFEDLRCLLDLVEQLIASGQVRSAWAVGSGGVSEAVTKMCFGNGIGFSSVYPLTAQPLYGAFVLEANHLPEWKDCIIGKTIQQYELQLSDGEIVDLEAVQRGWEGTLEPVYPQDVKQNGPVPSAEFIFTDAPPHSVHTHSAKAASPRALLLVFPGTTGEQEAARALLNAGAEPEILYVRNRTRNDLDQSVMAISEAISHSQMLIFPGGYSGGNEPDGAARLIESVMRHSEITDRISYFLERRDGLICGLGDGFSALVNLGLLPNGYITDPETKLSSLTANQIGLHRSGIVRTRIISNNSPWLCKFSEGEQYTMPFASSFGRFTADPEMLDQLMQNRQVATIYVDLEGLPSYDIRYNPAGSMYAIEGLLSPDGRIFGKMAHNERWAAGLYRNIPDASLMQGRQGLCNMDIFAGAVQYFR